MTLSAANQTGAMRRATEEAGVKLAQRRRIPWHVLVFGVLLAGAVALHAYDRGHSFMAPWDESVHAVVAEHLVRDPLHPRLYEIAALTPANYASWHYVTTWLHVPPLGLWAAALSMSLLGATPFAFRLPGLLCITLGMVVIYLLGRRLFGPVAGLAGAAVAGFAPYPLLISQGYMFGDMTDVPLMLLVPLAVFGIVRAYQMRRYRWLVVAGLAQGLSYLDKGGIGLAPTGVLLALIACERLLPEERGWARMGVRGLLLFAGSTLLVAVPFNVYVARAFPAAAASEGAAWRASFFTNVEDWGRPLDYHVTTYLYAMYGPALALLLAGAFIVALVYALRHRSRADVVVIVWIVAIYLPLSLAVTKTVNVTYSAVPAVGLVVGRAAMISVRSRHLLARAATVGMALGAAATAVLFAFGQLAPFAVPYQSIMPVRFYPADIGGLDQRVSLYLVEALLSAALGLICAAALAIVRRHGQSAGMSDPAPASGPLAPFVNGLPRPIRHALRPVERVRRGERALMAVACTLALVVLAAYWLQIDTAIVSTPRADSAPVEALGTLVARHTPRDATILMSSALPQIENMRLRVMFWGQRDVYSLPLLAVNPKPAPPPTLDGGQICPLVAQAAQVSSPLYVLTDQPYTGNALGTAQGWTLYVPACP